LIHGEPHERLNSRKENATLFQLKSVEQPDVKKLKQSLAHRPTVLLGDHEFIGTFGTLRATQVIPNVSQLTLGQTLGKWWLERIAD